MRGKTPKSVLGMLASACIAATVFAPIGGAEESATGGPWDIDTYGHPIEPYAHIPDGIDVGIPSTWIQLDGSGPRCQAISALYDPTSAIDGVLILASSDTLKYQNQTRAWAWNPEGTYRKKAEVAPFPGGPKATAECPTPTSGTGEATFGSYRSDSVSVESATTRSTNARVGDQELVVSETINKLQGVKIGDLAIGSILTWLKVEFRPSVEPKVSYRIEATGITNADTFSGAGHDGVVLSGQSIAGRELVKQFNEQVKSGQAAMAPLARYGLRIAEPRVGRSQTGRYVFEVSVFDGLFGPAARSGQPGDSQGLRLAASRVAGHYEYPGHASPSEGYDYIDDPIVGRS